MVEFATVEEYAERIKTPVSTVREMCRKGQLPAVKVGLRWHIDTELADEYLRTLCREKAPKMAKNGYKRVVKKPCKTRQKYDYLAEIKRMKEVV